MPTLNWALIQDGGVLESLMHAILYAKDRNTILFGRPGKDSGQDARTADGRTVYQSKYREGLDMDGAISLALKELEQIAKYLDSSHSNFKHWKHAKTWVLFGNFAINPNDDAKWKNVVIPKFQNVGLTAEYWSKETIAGELANHPEVRNVFFEYENRVLVGLKEAYELLNAECVGSDSLDHPLIGRKTELDLAGAFASSATKRVLPVIGPSGIGKSRFLFETLAHLSQIGWRCLWGLPGEMATSSSWFSLLNGTQPTCVALDDPDDPNLLRRVIEQLASVERSNWRVIIGCQSEHSEALRHFRNNRLVDSPIRLHELSESESQSLVNNCLDFTAAPEWVHNVYNFTKGNPGWLCLVAELAKNGELNNLPPRADDMARLYVDTCLRQVASDKVQQARVTLRWIALWGTLLFEPTDDRQKQIQFLDKEGIPPQSLRELLQQLTSSGLVRNWGIGKRLYAVEPLAIRQSLLSDWLLQDVGTGDLSVSPAGQSLANDLLFGNQPCLDATLRSLSQLALSRLGASDTYSFFRPIFQEMARAATSGTLLVQYRVTELIEKIGVADPESAVDVLAAIRSNPKPNQEIEVPLWGRTTLDHLKVLSNIPWILFSLAAQVDEQLVAGRFLNEFREHVLLESDHAISTDVGKSPRQLLNRLLGDSRNADAFLSPAHQIVSQHLLSDRDWPFVSIIASSLLEPVQESMHWVADWTATFSRTIMRPNSHRWNTAIQIRKSLFDALEQEIPESKRTNLWRLVADSHRSMHYAMARERMDSATTREYRAILVSDLTSCERLLRKKTTFGEATSIRPLWEWYLQYSPEPDLLLLARQCECQSNLEMSHPVQFRNVTLVTFLRGRWESFD